VKREKRVADAARNVKVAKQRISSACFQRPFTYTSHVIDALIGGTSRGMRCKDRSYYRGAENRCVLNTKNINYAITAAGTVKP